MVYYVFSTKGLRVPNEIGGVKNMLSERKQQILKVIIEDYTKSAEPISSKSICDRFKFSSATIRHEMNELESLGFLVKPHTSAGRIPSDLGYRFYVDNLLKSSQNLPVDLNFIEDFMSIKLKELDNLIHETSDLISKLTQYTSVVATPVMSKIFFKKTDILYVDEKSFVLTIVTDNNIIKTKMIKSDISLYKEEIEDLSEILNKLITHIDIQDIQLDRMNILYKLSHLSFIIDKIILFVMETIKELTAQRIYLGGESNILNYPEYENGIKAKDLIDFIKNPNMLKFAPSDNIRVRIGFENGNNPLSDASVVYTTYSVGAHDYGVIAVVGPKRMDYAKVSAYLSLYARQLSKIIEASFLASDKENDEGED